MLPKAFIERMQKMLGSEYEDFEKSFERQEYQALRLNPLKGDSGRFLALSPFSLTPVPWEKNGYYYEESDRPGKHPFHEAGVYYIQEPSAMLPVTLLDVKPGERILDLCAAPGGKSTQIAAAMEGSGILISNEINPQRAKILAENMERMGVKNAIVVNHEPAHLLNRFPAYFDKILVDAPCSGEGMFRKNEEAIKEWSPENVEMCAERQDGILEIAAAMLHPGGRIVYSTCTFSEAENEGSVERFLKNHPEFQLKKMERIWPHKVKGEGHFAAVLIKDGVYGNEKRYGSFGPAKTLPEKNFKEYTEFKRDYLRKELNGGLICFGDQLYLLPEEAPSLQGLRVLRAGLHLGTMKKNRFEPGHALALSLKEEDFVDSINLTLESGDPIKYLSGQTFQTDKANGWKLILIEGYSAGFGKAASGILKNHYPKGLRKNW